jgi:hypothetical protein
MEHQIEILNWLQSNPEILNHWYHNNMTSEDAVQKYKEGKKEFKYYLFGEDAIRVYNDGYEDKDGKEYEGAAAVIAANNDNGIMYDTFKEEVGVTTIQDFKEAIDGWMDSILISKEDYLNLA